MRGVLGRDLRVAVVKGQALVKITSSVWRAAREHENFVAVLVKTALPLELATAAVEDLLAEWRSSGDDVDDLVVLELQETTKGPAVVISHLDPTDLPVVLERLSERLGARGLGDVTLTAMPTANVMGGWKTSALIKCWMGFRGERPRDWTGLLGWDLARPTWEVSEADTAEAIEYLVDWARSVPGQRLKAAVASRDTFTPVPLSGVLPAIRRAVGAAKDLNGWPSLVVENAEGRTRWLNFAVMSGAVTASDGLRDGGGFLWQEHLDAVTEMLAEAGPWCGYGHVTRAGALDYYAVHADHGDREVRRAGFERDFFAAAALPSEGLLWDAYGVLRLPPGDADQFPLEPLWDLRAAAGGIVLARHRSLHSWFAEPIIDANVLAAARHTLASALIERVAEHPKMLS